MRLGGEMPFEHPASRRDSLIFRNVTSDVLSLTKPLVSPHPSGKKRKTHRVLLTDFSGASKYKGGQRLRQIAEHVTEKITNYSADLSMAQYPVRKAQKLPIAEIAAGGRFGSSKDLRFSTSYPKLLTSFAVTLESSGQEWGDKTVGRTVF